MANFEKDSGDILSMVSMLERHLIRDGFDSTSKPSIEQVEEALETTEQEIFIWLAAEGYSTDIADYSALANARGTKYRTEDGLSGMETISASDAAPPRGNSRWS